MKKHIISFLILIVVATAALISCNPKIHKKIVIESKTVLTNKSDIKNMTKNEKIVWNKWQSDVTNKIMATTEIRMSDEPVGTENHVEFKVDKQGNITNLNIIADPSEYTSAAQKGFGKSIRNLNGDSVLNFPKGSQRKIVTYVNNFVVGQKTEYTKPSNFNDYETVVR